MIESNMDKYSITYMFMEFRSWRIEKVYLDNKLKRLYGKQG